MRTTARQFLVALLIAYPGLFLSGQGFRGMPAGPFEILHSWTPDSLVERLGIGQDLVPASGSRQGRTGLAYPGSLLDIPGRFEYFISRDSISLVRFVREYPARVIPEHISIKIASDTIFRNQFNREITIEDSLRRDTVVRVISRILGNPVESGNFSPGDRNVRFSAVWNNDGYSCSFRDYLTYSDITFSSPKISPTMAVEFGIPSNAEILRKIPFRTKRLNCTLILTGIASPHNRLAFADYFLLVEYPGGQRYVENIPRLASSFFQVTRLIRFPGGPLITVALPLAASGYLPQISFEDLDGDAVPDVRVSVPVVPGSLAAREYIYTLRYKEPNLIFNSDDFLPLSAEISDSGQLKTLFTDGTIVTVPVQSSGTGKSRPGRYFGRGFESLEAGNPNKDGSCDFTGRMVLELDGQPTNRIRLELNLTAVTGGWELSSIRPVN